jgi:hypothetical protein
VAVDGGFEREARLVEPQPGAEIALGQMVGVEIASP